MCEDIFVQSLNMIYIIHFDRYFNRRKNYINEEYIDKYNECVKNFGIGYDYGNILYSFDYLLLDENYMLQFMKKIHKNIDMVVDKQLFFTALHDIKVFKDEHKRVYYEIFYGEYKELRSVLKNNGITLKSYIVNGHRYNKKENSIRISNKKLLDKCLSINGITYTLGLKPLDEFDLTTTCYSLLACPKDEVIDCNKNEEDEKMRIYNLLQERMEDEPLCFAKFYIRIYDLDKLTIKNETISKTKFGKGMDLKYIYDLPIPCSIDYFNSNIVDGNVVYLGVYRDDILLNFGINLHDNPFEIKIVYSKK